MTSDSFIIDELPESTHKNFRTHRDFITHVDGSSLTGEQYLNAFIRTRTSGNIRTRLADLVPTECEGSREWRNAEGQLIYVERPIPTMFSSLHTREYDKFVEWIEEQRK